MPSRALTHVRLVAAEGVSGGGKHVTIAEVQRLRRYCAFDETL